MANYNTTPHMNLPNPVPSVDPGPDYATNLQSSLNIVDQHNHSTGRGVQIQPNGLNISSDLPFNSNNATLLRSTRYVSQGAALSGAMDVGCLYVVGNELYYNDVTGGHQIQITLSGSVNATSRGIASGTASAAFSFGTLVVNSSSTSFANVDVQSIILANSGNISNQLTLQAPALSSSYSLSLPYIPSSLSVLTVDTSGNFGYTMNSTAADPVGQAMSSTGANAVAASTSNPNFGGKAAQENGKNLVVSNSNATNSLAIIRGQISGTSVVSGEGFTVTNLGSNQFQVNFSTAFGDTPVVVASNPNSGSLLYVFAYNASTSSVVLALNNGSSYVADPISFIAIGQRA